MACFVIVEFIRESGYSVVITRIVDDRLVSRATWSIISESTLVRNHSVAMIPGARKHLFNGAIYPSINEFTPASNPIFAITTVVIDHLLRSQKNSRDQHIRTHTGESFRATKTENEKISFNNFIKEMENTDY